VQAKVIDDKVITKERRKEFEITWNDREIKDLAKVADEELGHLP
jgi:hypothetical protein